MPCGQGRVYNRTLRFADSYGNPRLLVEALVAMGFDKTRMKVEGGALVARFTGQYGMSREVRFVKTEGGLVPEVQENTLAELDRRWSVGFKAQLGLAYNGALVGQIAARTNGKLEAAQEGDVLTVRITVPVG